MRLILSLRNPLPDHIQEMIFDRRGGSVGREGSCDWVISDPEKLISRRHFRVDYDGGRYCFIDTSANGTFIDDLDEPIRRGEAIDAEQVTTLSIGRFCIDVALEPTAALEPNVETGWPEPGTVSPGSWPGSGTGSVPGWTPRETASNAGGNWPGTDDPAGEGGISRTAEIPGDWARYGAGQAGGQETPGETPPQPPSAGRTKPSQHSAGEAAANVPPPPSVRSRGGEEYDAFLEAAGISRRDLAGADPVEVMRQAGAVFQMMAAGLHGLLAARAALKHEMHIDRTSFSINPLKTSPDAAEAVRSLLRPPSRSAMSGEDAVREVVTDIESHELAMTAGMNAALTALLDRFSPERLAEGLDRSSLLENLVPAARRSKYWQAYEEQYRGIVDEAECNFHRLFGEEFTRAYLETAMRGLRGKRRRRS